MALRARRSWAALALVLVLVAGVAGADGGGSVEPCAASPELCGLCTDGYDLVLTVAEAENGDGLEGMVKALLRRL